jgi:hypothetical protein
MKKVYFSIFVAVLLSQNIMSAPNTIENVIYGMVGEPFRQGSSIWGAHEGKLHGLPDGYSWAPGASPGAWTNPTQFQCPALWGQIYEWANGSPETNIRIQVRNHRHLYLQNGEWKVFGEFSESLGGVHFNENFNGNSDEGDRRPEPISNGGGISFSMRPNLNYHWWSPVYPRAVKPNGYVDAWLSTAEVRLIPHTNPNVDLTKAKYLAGVGFDWYSSPTHVSSGEPIVSAGLSRHVWVTPEWKHVNFLIVGANHPTSEAEYLNFVAQMPRIPGVTYDGIVVSPPTPDTIQIRDTLEAESAGVLNNLVNKGNLLGNSGIGSFAAFKLHDFGNEFNSVAISYGVPDEYAGNIWELRVDSQTGAVVGTLTTKSSGDWETMRTDTIPISNLSGVKDLYLVGKKGGGINDWISDLDRLVFLKTLAPVEAPTSLFESSKKPVWKMYANPEKGLEIRKGNNWYNLAGQKIR